MGTRLVTFVTEFAQETLLRQGLQLHGLQSRPEETK